MIVTFAIGEGEIHALLGENGAGKSTMVKMIYGLVRPDQGQMTLRGAAYTPSKPAEARRLGWERVMLVGDAPYYARFGFRKLTGVEMPPPTNPDRVLGLDLKAGAWDGVTGVVTKAT